MNDRRSNEPDADSLEYALESFAERVGSEGFSLEQLSQAYAEALSRGEDPYAQTGPGETATAQGAAEGPLPDEAFEDEPGDELCEVTPRSIVEAMLFVGRPDNRPLSSHEIAALMRGVRPAEIDEAVEELNQIYAREGRPYYICSEGAGYRFMLHQRFEALREKFFGRVRRARLSQAAIDVLAIVAYNQPVTRDEVDQLRGKASGSTLRQLVRRELLRVERAEEGTRRPNYHTTDRFLSLFGLDALSDLPRSQDAEGDI